MSVRCWNPVAEKVLLWRSSCKKARPGSGVVAEVLLHVAPPQALAAAARAAVRHDVAPLQLCSGGGGGAGSRAQPQR